MASRLPAYCGRSVHPATPRAYSPVPDSATLNGTLVALVAMLSFADLPSAAAGVNVTPIVQEAPAAGLAPQSFVCANQAA